MDDCCCPDLLLIIHLLQPIVNNRDEIDSVKDNIGEDINEEGVTTRQEQHCIYRFARVDLQKNNQH
jgi:hypothetical protein